MQSKIVLSASVLVLAATFASAGPVSISHIEDNDLLLDAKGASVDLGLLKKRGCNKGSVTISHIEDNDVVDAKGFELGIDLLKRNAGKVTISHIEDNDLLLDAKGASVNLDLLKKRNAGKVTISHVEDNDLVDVKGASVDVDVLKRRARPCNKPKVTITHIEDNDVIDAKDASVNVDILKRQETPPTCPAGTHLVPQGYHCGILYYEDNDVVDLKDLSVSICLLSGGCETTPATTPSYLGALGNYVCQDPLGCCVQNKGKHHGKTITYIEDNDLIDAKGASLNLSVL